MSAVQPNPGCVLGQFSFAERWEHPEDTEVLGALDLGGASTQITFQPGVPVQDGNTSVFFRLYGTNYSLYSHSYLCYGQSQALKMLLAALHQVPGARGLLSHLPVPWHISPCSVGRACGQRVGNWLRLGFHLGKHDSPHPFGWKVVVVVASQGSLLPTA